jgi:hypothetical protein
MWRSLLASLVAVALAAAADGVAAAARSPTFSRNATANRYPIYCCRSEPLSSTA